MSPRFRSAKYLAQKKNKRREATFVFLAQVTSKRPMKSDREREARVCEFDRLALTHFEGLLKKIICLCADEGKEML